jgi:hypothetical protein
MNIEINIFTVLKKDLKNVSEETVYSATLKSNKYISYKLIAFLKTLQRLKQEWQKSLAPGPGKQMAKTWFGLEKKKKKFQCLPLLTVLPLNYFML